MRGGISVVHEELDSLPSFCPNAAVASWVLDSPPQAFAVFRVTAPHFLWGALISHPLTGGLVFLHRPAMVMGRGPNEGLSRALAWAPDLRWLPYYGRVPAKEPAEGEDRQLRAGRPVTREPWTLKPTPRLTSHLHEITNALFFLLPACVGLPQTYIRKSLLISFRCFTPRSGSFNSSLQLTTWLYLTVSPWDCRERVFLNNFFFFNIQQNKTVLKYSVWWFLTNVYNCVITVPNRILSPSHLKVLSFSF